MSGASAMSGTVWLRITNGSTAHSATRSRCMRSASSEPDHDPEQPAEPREPEADGRGLQHHEAEGQGARRTGDRLDDAGDHVPDVRHREVARARQHPEARPGDALLRSEHPASAGPTSL